MQKIMIGVLIKWKYKESIESVRWEGRFMRAFWCWRGGDKFLSGEIVDWDLCFRHTAVLTAFAHVVGLIGPSRLFEIVAFGQIPRSSHIHGPPAVCQSFLFQPFHIR